MTDLPGPAGEDDPATRMLAAALPDMRAVKIKGWLICTAAVVVTVALMMLAAGAGREALQFVFLAAFPGFFAIGATVRWVRRSHERAVLPTISEAFGLLHEKSPRGFFETLPKNFIPQGGKRTVDDMMNGKVAGRTFRFAECKTETGGKNSSTLFQGVVIEVQASGTVPEFLIASEKETKGFLFFKGKVQVQDMQLVHQATGHNGETYGLWARSDAPGRMVGLRAFMDRVIALGPRVLGNSTLFSLVSTGRYYYISLRHKRDLFRIGGMLSSEDQVIRQIRAAATELAHPIDLAGQVLQAEEALLAAK